MRAVVGGPAAMRRRLQHLTIMADRPNVTLRVIAAGAGTFPSPTRS